MTRSVLAALIAGTLLGLLTLRGIGQFGPRLPILDAFAPWSFPIVFVLFATHVDYRVLACLVTGAFWSWSWFLFRGRPRVPLRTVFAFAAVAILSLVHFVSSWRRGIEFFPGPTLTVSYAILDSLCAAGLAFLLLRARHSPSFRRNLTLHTLLFAWIITYAFPWLMEWP